ncbi:hypothetical protein [Acetobacterium sp.]|uniref:hypothetical protein n=1 Tax=Acetobacterium sp. TaxID=1872094 RepID=UPI002F3F21B2
MMKKEVSSDEDLCESEIDSSSLKSEESLGNINNKTDSLGVSKKEFYEGPLTVGDKGKVYQYINRKHKTNFQKEVVKDIKLTAIFLGVIFVIVVLIAFFVK